MNSFDSFDLYKEEKSLSTYKYLKENLKPKTNEIYNKAKVNNKKNKSKEKILKIYLIRIYFFILKIEVKRIWLKYIKMKQLILSIRSKNQKI